MSGISADDANFLLACKKVLGHYVSSVAACSHDDVHRVSSLPGLDAHGGGLDSADSTNFRVAQQRAWRLFIIYFLKNASMFLRTAVGHSMYVKWPQSLRVTKRA